MKYFIRTAETPVASLEAFVNKTIPSTLARVLESRKDPLLTAVINDAGEVRFGWIEDADESWALDRGYELMTFKVKEETPYEKFKAKAVTLEGPFKFTCMKSDGGVDLKYLAWAKKYIVVYDGAGASRVVDRMTKGRKKLAARFITLEQFLSQ